MKKEGGGEHHEESRVHVVVGKGIDGIPRENQRKGEDEVEERLLIDLGEDKVGQRDGEARNQGGVGHLHGVGEAKELHEPGNDPVGARHEDEPEIFIGDLPEENTVTIFHLVGVVDHGPDTAGLEISNKAGGNRQEKDDNSWIIFGELVHLSWVVSVYKLNSREVRHSSHKREVIIV